MLRWEAFLLLLGVRAARAIDALQLRHRPSVGEVLLASQLAVLAAPPPEDTPAEAAARLIARHVRSEWAALVPLLRRTRLVAKRRAVPLHDLLLHAAYGELCDAAPAAPASPLAHVLLELPATIDPQLLEAAGVHVRLDERGLSHALLQLAHELPAAAAASRVEQESWTLAFERLDAACLANLTDGEAAAVSAQVGDGLCRALSLPAQAELLPEMASLLPPPCFRDERWSELRAFLSRERCIRTAGGVAVLPSEALLYPSAISCAFVSAAAAQLGRHLVCMRDDGYDELERGLGVPPLDFPRLASESPAAGRAPRVALEESGV